MLIMKWNEKLKQARETKQLTQIQVANNLKISRGAYANYEQGVHEPSLEMLRKICDLLDISADYLIGRIDY